MTTASFEIKELGETARTNTGSYKNALNTVVDKVALLDGLDFTSLSNRINLTVNDISEKINQNILRPSVVSELASKVKCPRTDYFDNILPCTGQCVSTLQAKFDEISSKLVTAPAEMPTNESG